MQAENIDVSKMEDGPETAFISELAPMTDKEFLELFADTLKENIHEHKIVMAADLGELVIARLRIIAAQL